MPKYFTNAPRSYDYGTHYHAGTIKRGEIRVLQMTEQEAEFQLPRNASGLFWTTTDKDEAFSLASMSPYTGE
jgi:hypothetical protein